MLFIQNFPFFSILLCMTGAIFSSVFNKKYAKMLSLFIAAAVSLLSIGILIHSATTGEAYAFMMGHFPAPIGNEIRISVLESLLASIFSLVVLFILLSGLFDIDDRVSPRKQNLFYIMVDLALAALLVMLYTNDLFTAYVFIEINSIAACALVVISQHGHSIVAATRYVIMNLLASGLTLFGISILYGITGHLLMPQLQGAVQTLAQSGDYAIALKTAILLISAGLAIKSALYPFHIWAPDAYASSPPVSASILSGIVSKGYIFLLIKLFYRVFTMDVIHRIGILDIFFVFGTAGMIFGSVSAIRQTDISRMIAYSSVAQIGYIFFGIGMGTENATIAAIFHMITHAVTKPVLFISASGLSNASKSKKVFHYLHGAGYRNKAAGFAFTLACFSMVGIPLTSGFISKIRLSVSGIEIGGIVGIVAVLSLALSTLLNAFYFMHTVVSLYRKEEVTNPDPLEKQKRNMDSFSRIALVVFSLFTVALGVFSAPIIQMLKDGIKLFH